MGRRGLVAEPETGTLPATGVDNVHVGHYAQAEQTAPAEIYLDEVVADRVFVPCH